MKRVIYFLALWVLLLSAGMANAGSFTISDVIDPSSNVYISWFGSYTYTHNIIDDGFNPYEDTILNASIAIKLYDDDGKWCDLVEFSQITFDDKQADIIEVDDETYRYTVNIKYLQTDGQLVVTLTSLFGDFYFDRSTLQVCGTRPDQAVPEPATLLLLGAGLTGLALAGKKFRKR